MYYHFKKKLWIFLLLHKNKNDGCAVDGVGEWDVDIAYSIVNVITFVWELKEELGDEINAFDMVW